MKRNLPVDLNIPVLFINPPYNGNPGLISAVHSAGGLGVVDSATAGPASFSAPEGVPYGVRASLKDIQTIAIAGEVKLAVLPFENAPDLDGLESGELSKLQFPVFAEIGGADQAKAAENAGAGGLITRGAEGAGRVSEINGLPLLQEVLAATKLPVFVQGGVDLRTATGAMAAGAAGVVLDVHLLLTPESGLEPSLKEFLAALSLPTTVTLADIFGAPCRVYSRIGTKAVRELREVEKTLMPDELPSYLERISALMANTIVESPDTEDTLLPLSEDIAVAKRLSAKYESAEAILNAFSRSLTPRHIKWPFGKDSAVSKAHGTDFPLVQGPMAHVSDNADFLAAVGSHGALPFLAMGNMPPPIAKESLEQAHEKTGGHFGVGLIGLDINQDWYEEHLRLMSLNPPPFAILAAGSVELARRIEEEVPTVCYLHCPARSMVSEGLKAGHRHFVFEGSESGGHIGLLGSLDLWSSNLHELDSAAEQGLDLSEVTVLFAGGIAGGRASAFLAGMVDDLVARGLRVGIQIGTAYLITDEAVATTAITETYRDMTLANDRTVIIGRTVNIKARGAGSKMASRLIELELERVRDGLPLQERKILFEKDNLGALRRASKGCAIDPTTATSECPMFHDLDTDQQLEQGLYLMGQGTSSLKNRATMAQIHAEICDDGRTILESSFLTEAHEALPGVLAEEPEVEPEMDQEPIAVVGIGLLLPGSTSPDAFWQQIMTGRSGIVQVPDDRWDNVDYYYDADPKAPDKTYSRIGGFVVDFQFNPIRYRIPPMVAGKMDRTQQMAIACAAAAMEDAGLTPEALKERTVGIILGNSMGGENTDQYAARLGLQRTLNCLDTALSGSKMDPEERKALFDSFADEYLEGLPEITEDSLPGELANVISGRVANVFNLAGPNFTVDAACASSMAALMNAVASLREGAIDCAITGGIDGAMHPSAFIKFCKVGALSPDGSRPFDENANGFVMGEGAGILILKRLSDAVRDKDRIYATVVGIGSSSDGKGKGITAPKAKCQERAVKRCLESGNIPMDSIGLIEAHGTSTKVGDTTELTVLDKLFRESGKEPGSVGVGSVKSQIGHLKAAAGAAGLIKAILSLHHKTLPPTANIETPNPCVDWDTSPLSLMTESRPWEPNGSSPRRAGVSAFGFGGTNFHVVVQEHVPGLRIISSRRRKVESAEFSPPQWPSAPGMTTTGEAWVIGAEDEAALASAIRTVVKDLNPSNFTQLATRLREQARRYPVRCGFAALDSDAAGRKLEIIAAGLAEPPKRAIFPAKGIYFSNSRAGLASTGVAFIFPGQGSQYPFMLRDLVDRFPIVSETLSDADEILVSIGSQTVTSAMFPEMPVTADGVRDAAAAMQETQLLQPMILAANVAIFRVLGQYGVRPIACAGHSLGEYAACVAAGVFSFRDGLEAVAVRGREMSKISIADPGIMMSVPTDARTVDEVLAKIDGYAVAANKNSPTQTVISGETAAVKEAQRIFLEQGVEGTILPVSAAFHSGVVAPGREPFMKTLRTLTVNQPSVPVISNVTGDFYPTGPAAPDRILDLLSKQFAAPVEWVKTLRRLHADGITAFLECGPKRVMTNLTLDTLGREVLALPTNHPKKGGILQLMEALAALAVEGAAVNWTGRERPELRVVSTEGPRPSTQDHASQKTEPSPLDALLDEELQKIVKQREFGRFLELQAEPVRDLIKSSFKSFISNILPMDKTIRKVKSEGVDFQPVVVSGISAGLPSDVRFPFDKANLDDLILGRSFIKSVPQDGRLRMVEKNIERLFKGPSGEAEFQAVENVSDVIKLAGYFHDGEVTSGYGMDERLAESMDVTTRLAVAAGLEALKDAGIPLVMQTRTTSTGRVLPESWALPESLRRETGVIFASAFPGLSSLVDEVTRETASRYESGARKRLIDFYTGFVSKVTDDEQRDEIASWFAEEFAGLKSESSNDLYTFNRSFLMKVMSLASGQMAQFIRAQGPNTHIDAACASTTQAILLAKDWIRTGQAKRVLVVAADDVAGKTLLPWVGSGFLAMGAATTNGNLDEAAIPFDNRRNGLILGSAAAGMVIEREDVVEERGMEALSSIEAGVTANSAYHGTRLDVEHIAALMEQLIEKWETQSSRSRDELAEDVFFMSHETYSPKRGGSAAAEIQALRKTFGDKSRLIPIANTKGFTGHTMGVGIEDVAAMRCLQKGILPPIANLNQPDPDFADLNLSRGGPCKAGHVLRLAAGFGSQIVMALYKVRSRSEERISDADKHEIWLKEITGYRAPSVSVENRTLKVAENPVQDQRVEAKLEAAPVNAPTTQSIAPDANQSESPEPPPAQPKAAEVQSTLKSQRTADEVKEAVLTRLAEKTGYPAEMLDTDLDMESDLGIDTVKQAEFISDIRDTFGIGRIEGLKISDFPTIMHIIRFVMENTAAPVAADSQTTPETAVPETAPVMTATAGDESDIQQQILILLSAKTGYPADMLDTDLDLESDLGIDTVKQAEFISDVRDKFGIGRIEGLKISDFPTIKHIIGFVQENMAQAPQESAAETTRTTPDASPMKVEEVRMFETRLVSAPAFGSRALPELDEVLVVGGPEELAEEVGLALRSMGYEKVRRQEASSIPEDLAGRRIGIVNLIAMEHNHDAVKRTFDLCLSLAQTFEKGPELLITAVAEDGAFGFESPEEDGYLAGGVAGATKAFSREYPNTLAQLLDLHPSLDVSRTAESICRSLREDFPGEAGVDSDGALKVVRLIPTPDVDTDPDIQPDDVVLVSGGAKGITAECVKHIAKDRRLKLVILGRTPLSDRAEELAGFGPDHWELEKHRIIDDLKQSGAKPTPALVDKELSRLKGEAEVFRTVADLQSADAKVMYRVLDIRDTEGVDHLVQEVAESFGKVDLVVHAAGVDVSRSLKGKTLEEMDLVYSVKVEGMRNILGSLEKHKLSPRRIIGFGSVSGRFGNLAQVDYSSANDSLAHLLRRVDRVSDAKVSTIDWAPWSEIGMATRGSVQAALESAGIDFITPPQGANLFARELARTAGASEVVAAGRLGPFAESAFGATGAEEETEAVFAGQKGRIVSIVPGEYVRATVELDPSHDLLNDHRIERAAVLPGVGGMEIMRAATVLLNPEAQTATYENVRFPGAVKVFGEDCFGAEVEVIRVDSSEDGLEHYSARLISWFKDKQGRKVGEVRLHHHCRLVVGRDKPKIPSTEKTYEQRISIAFADIYEAFFHGPQFHLLDHVMIRGDAKGVRFGYQDTPRRGGMFSDVIPAAMEAVFQAIAAFGVETSGVMVLPTKVDSLTIYNPNAMPHIGDLRLVADRRSEVVNDRRAVSFDGEIRDRNGEPVLAVKGAEMMEAGEYAGFRARIFEEVVSVEDVTKQIEKDEASFLEKTLSSRETEEYRTKTIPKRASEWMSGRVALKNVVRRLLESSGAEAPLHSGIQVIQDEQGKPTVDIPGMLHPGRVSISHSSGLAVAAATATEMFAGLGVDIEKVMARSESWVRDYFTEREIRSAGEGDDRWLELTKIWSLKEAALKALGTGLRFDLKEIEASPLGAAVKYLLEFKNEAAQYLKDSFPGSIEAIVEHRDGIVFARVMIRQT